MNVSAAQQAYAGSQGNRSASLSQDLSFRRPQDYDCILSKQTTPGLRDGLMTKTTGEATLAERTQLAQRVVRAGGTGTQADVDLVVAELAKMPASALRNLIANGTTVIACRNSVTDYATNLAGVQPRGWPPGATWDSVPGAAMISNNEVIISVIGHETTGGAHVPRTGEGHGSSNLVIHEVAHAVDHNQSATRDSGSRDFVGARNRDFAVLTPYQQQTGTAGREETYAESAARYYGGHDGTVSTPALDAYWRDNPLGGR
jgi:hypothetical protein